jgi:hypothetical protein
VEQFIISSQSKITTLFKKEQVETRVSRVKNKASRIESQQKEISIDR